MIYITMIFQRGRSTTNQELTPVGKFRVRYQAYYEGRLQLLGGIPRIFWPSEWVTLKGNLTENGSTVSHRIKYRILMVLLYMVLHGSHQYTPVMLALMYQHQPDPSWVMDDQFHQSRSKRTTVTFKMAWEKAGSSKLWPWRHAGRSPGAFMLSQKCGF